MTRLGFWFVVALVICATFTREGVYAISGGLCKKGLRNCKDTPVKRVSLKSQIDLYYC